MTEIERVRVVDKDGLLGTVVERLESERGSETRLLVKFDDGQQVLVPANTLVMQQDGTYYLPVSRATLEQVGATSNASASETVVLPVIEETLDVQRRTVETGRVRVSKLVREREEVVDEPLLREQVDVERVSVNRVVDAPVEVRREGDTLIIPILEEVLVVEKRLMLKEEVRVRLQRTEVHEPQQVTLRSEDIVVERVDPQTPRDDSGTDRA